MGSKLEEIGSTFEVRGDDLKEMKRQRRRDKLTRIAQAVSVIGASILGILTAEAVYPVRAPPPWWYSYPFVPLALVSSVRTYYERRSWKGPIILSVALFIVTFLLVSTFNSAQNDNYGSAPKYSVFSKSVLTRR